MSICSELQVLDLCLSVIDVTTLELEDIYQTERPYNIKDTIYGSCYTWEIEFIEKVLYTMSTDSLDDMSNAEKTAWFDLVVFQDGKTNSANDSIPNAIGCTIPDSNGNSYVVTNIGTTSQLCEEPLASVPKELASGSLDDVLMAIYNCEEYNQCTIDTGTGTIEDLTDVSPCLLATQ